MKLLMRVSSTNDFSGPDYAVVEMSEESVREIAARRDLVRRMKEGDSELDDVRWWCYWADWFSGSLEGVLDGATAEETELKLDTFGFVPLDEVDVSKMEPSRTDLGRMVVDDDSFRFTACPKDGDDHYSTWNIDADLLRKEDGSFDAAEYERRWLAYRASEDARRRKGGG